MTKEKLKNLLDELTATIEVPDFIQDDPVRIPHRFERKQDKEIAGFIAAIFAWGQRKTIINKANRFLELMGDSPYEFVLEHREHDRGAFDDFVHRTFQPADAHYVLERLQRHYQQHESLETLFTGGQTATAPDVEPYLRNFHNSFFDVPHAPKRTQKHIATPARNSSCKRINMFLRWMVRSNAGGVDLGLWNTITPAQLIAPLDVHVHRVAHKLKLVDRKQHDWKAAVQLTKRLRTFNAEDPVRYDFALFGAGVKGII